MAFSEAFALCRAAKPRSTVRTKPVIEDGALVTLAAWLGSRRVSNAIAKQTTIRTAKTSQGERTTVTIDHLLTCEEPGYPGWRITTKHTLLPSVHFGSEARMVLTGGEGRRTIYAQSLAGDREVLAAIRFHIEEAASRPLFILMIGTREDAPPHSALEHESLAAAYVLKQYVHAVARKLGRQAELYIDLHKRDTASCAERFGFEKAQRLKGLRVSGALMRQPPLR